MQYLREGNAIRLPGAVHFDPVKTFECGQCFRWSADQDGVYTGIARGCACRVRRDGPDVLIQTDEEAFKEVWYDYFDLDTDYSQICASLAADSFMASACAFGAGIRILRQDPWEALCSFIFSQCNNIPRIKKIVDIFCREFGQPFGYGGKTLFAFPTAERTARASAQELAALRCGYRAKYITAAAEAVVSGALNLEVLRAGSCEDARRALKALNGVGDKVADCVLLFGLQMYEAFPKDVWVRRALSENYGGKLDPAVFGPWAGLAQQYIFYYARSR